MKIAMLLSNPFRPDPRVQKEAESLAGFGYQVTVICWDREAGYPPEEVLPSGVRIIRIQDVPSQYGIGVGQLRVIPKFWGAALIVLNALAPELVHCHDFDTLPAGIWWGKRHKIPVIYDAHEYYAELIRPRLQGWIGKLVYHGVRLSEQMCARMADAVITVDRTLANIYRKTNRRVLVVGHYPMLSMADQDANPFHTDELHLLYAGRISTDRGMLVYQDIIRMLREAGIPARLTLAGAFLPETELEIFQQASQDILQWITILGWVPYPEMPAVLRKADIGLVILLPEPRYVAAIPVKLFEYMAAGLPVVASDFPAIREIVAEHQCGVLVDPIFGVQSAVQAITSWWQDRTSGRCTGERGRQAVITQYNWELLMEKLSELYQELLPEK
jgi:hypothetical protein